MLREGRKYTFIYDILFSQAACQIKLSLLWFSRRLIGVASGGIFRSSYASLIALLVIVGMCEILFIIVSFLECRYDILITLLDAFSLYQDFKTNPRRS